MLMAKPIFRETREIWKNSNPLSKPYHRWGLQYVPSAQDEMCSIDEGALAGGSIDYQVRKEIQERKRF